MTHRSWTRWLGLALVLGALVLGGFADDGTADTTVVVIDDRGQEIVIEETPERVVVAGTPLYTEILVDIGATEALVGITDSPDNPPEVADVPTVGPSLEPNVERIIELDPDLVFGAIRNVRDQLENAGVTVLTPIQFISSVPSIFEVARTLGLVMDRTVQANLLIGRVSESIVEAESAVAERSRPDAAFLYASSDGPPFAVGTGSIEGKVLARAGGQNVFNDIQGVQQVSLEAIIERDPDVVFTDPSQIANLTDNERLSSVSAIQNDRVFGIKASTLTSTRVAQALRQMAAALHPDAFHQDDEDGE